MGPSGWGWGDDEMHLLDEVSEPDTPAYPHGEKGQMQRSRLISGGPFPGPERPVSRAGAARFQGRSSCPGPTGRWPVSAITAETGQRRRNV